ncbi:hypothetical protein QTP70_001538 [Hemibagrus guttatus]|uniref:ADGRF3/5-like N-terminal domain-containing protein n=1 Tax=Hemibagrus guttatus TaxID=175788 RepID=A0AAE0QG24_9TELE|nr:hypothetical protein QTP70_001538 [Hemibagrus guttatus]
MLRRGVNASTQPDEKHPLVVIAKCVAILTPLFGLTWGFGIGTMVSSNYTVVFAFLNSLEGFFILVFGTLLDSKVCIKTSISVVLCLRVLVFCLVPQSAFLCVCQPNDSQYQCTCVDQYVWSYNNCITYNACDKLNEGTCTCISAIPSDGQVCVPKTVEGVLTNIVDKIYPGTDLKLTCNPPENNSIKWTLNGIQLQKSAAKYAINNVELTVKNAGPSDSVCDCVNIHALQK